MSWVGSCDVGPGCAVVARASLPADTMAAMTVRIVTVCTGNVCRSPYAQLLLQHRLDEVRPGAFEVESLGTGALVDAPIDAGSARHLEAKGIAFDTFRGRQISERGLEGVNLALPLTVEHRKAVLSHAPRLLKRCFTVKEIARLIDAAQESEPWSQRLAGTHTPEERWAQITQHLTRERGRHRVEDGIDDVADPYRQDDSAFELMASEIDAAVDRIVWLESLAP